MAEVPDGPPRKFTWRRVEHDVVLAEGPERIASEWWRTPGEPSRDYYRIEDAEGRRFWLYRVGEYEGPAAPRWYLHGLFA
jgi:protein ImuB